MHNGAAAQYRLLEAEQQVLPLTHLLEKLYEGKTAAPVCAVIAVD